MERQIPRAEVRHYRLGRKNVLLTMREIGENGFTEATDMRISALIVHSQCSDHVLSVNLMPHQTAMKGHCEKANETFNKKLCSQLQVVFHKAKNDIVCHRYVGLTDLLRAVKAPDFVTCGHLPAQELR